MWYLRVKTINQQQTMELSSFILLLGTIAIIAGLLGSLVGIGGGIIIVPVLTIFFHINIRLAIGASIVSVIATSSGAAIAYIKDNLTNLKAGMFLELGTTLGAFSGAYLTTLINVNILYILFSIILLYSAFIMLKHNHKEDNETVLKTSKDKLANALNLHGQYYDSNLNKTIKYKLTHTKVGLGLMYLAGLVSALLGVGSGMLKVPAMDIAMRMPIKASAATSDFMIGVTAAASAGAYFARGQINPILAWPIALGVLIGALIGSRLLNKFKPHLVQLVFIFILIAAAIEMINKVA